MLPDAWWAVPAGLLGLAVGSFLNVVIDRVPAGESLLRPPPRCPACGTAIRLRHRVPIVGWLLRHGRCLACRTPSSPRYPIVELVTGTLFFALTWRVLALGLPAAVPAYLYFAAIGVALTIIDIEHRRLPDKIVLPSWAVLAALLTLASLTTGDWAALRRAGIGAAALFTLYLLLALIYPAGMGLGDVKLAFTIGAVLAYLSWRALAFGAFGAFLLGSLGAIALIASGRGGRKTTFPFGPYMITAALLLV